MSVLQQPSISHTIFILCKGKNHCHVPHSSLDFFFPPQVYRFNICAENIVNEASVVHFQLYPEWHLWHLLGRKKKINLRLKSNGVLVHHRVKAILWPQIKQTCTLFRQQIWKYWFRNVCNRFVSPHVHANSVCCWAHLHGLPARRFQYFPPALTDD